MKLLLTSAGFTTEAIIQACEKLCAKPRNDISFAAIIEGYAVEIGDKRWVLNDLNNIVGNFQGEIDLINLLALTPAQIKQRIASKDAIFVDGGHTDYLMSVMNKSGFTGLLPELLKTKVYVGSSAGSMVAGNRLSSAAYAKIYGEEGDYGVTQYLDLANFAFKPHFNSPLWPNNRTEVLAEVSRDIPGVIYGVGDDTAIIVQDDTVSFVGPAPCRLENGRVAAH